MDSIGACCSGHGIRYGRNFGGSKNNLSNVD